MRGNQATTTRPVDRWQRLPLRAAAQPRDDRGGRGAGRARRLRRAGRGQGVQPRGRLPHARDRHLDLVLLGHGAQLRPDDKALTASIREAQGKVFQEDLEMLESQQRNLSAQPERKLLSLGTDLGGVQARRIVERLVTQERGQAPGPTHTQGSPA
jgi:vanillate O-demethylase monooxygenase subunit